MGSLFSSAKQDQQIGLDFQPDGVAVVQVQSGKKNRGSLVHSEYLGSVGAEAQAEALSDWVSRNRRQKTPCVCLLSEDDYDVFQIDKPEVEDAELQQALGWRIKDLVSYEIGSAVIDSYPMPSSSKNKTQQISVVSAHESVVGSYVDCVKKSGLELIAIDIHDLVTRNLDCIRQANNQTQAILSLDESEGWLSIYQDSDLYVSRNFKIGVNQIKQADAEDESVYDAMLLEIQRSMDYYESYYGLAPVSSLLIFPQIQPVEKMALYLQNFTNFDIDFIPLEKAPKSEASNLEAICFHAYCAAMRGVQA